MSDWTMTDVETLADMAAAGKNGRAIAAALDKTYKAVVRKAATLQMSLQPGALRPLPAAVFKPKVIFWTPERLDTLIKMAADGFSGSKIATALGTTRSAVIGKARRDGIQLGISHGKSRRPVVRERRTPREAKIDTATIKKIVRVFLAPPPPKQPEFPFEAPPHGVTFDALDADGCRWPTGSGPYLFCNQPRRFKSYCGCHARLAYERFAA